MGLKDIALWQEQDWITAIAAAVLAFFLLGGAYIATRKEPEFVSTFSFLQRCGSVFLIMGCARCLSFT